MNTARMRIEKFQWPALCLCWAADLTLLAFFFSSGGPAAGVVCFFVAGSVLTLLLVRFCPEGRTERQVFVQVFCMAVFGRLVFVLFTFHSPAAQAGRAAEPLYFQVALILSDLALVCVLAGVLRLRKLPPNRLLLYAASPLVLTAVAGPTQADALIAPLLVVALWLLLSGKTNLGFAALGATAVNPFVAAASWPYFVHRRNWKKGLLLLPAPALLMAAGGLDHRTVSRAAAFGNGGPPVEPVAAVLQAVFGGGATAAALLLWCGCLLMIYLLEPDPARDVYLAIGALIVFLGGADARLLLLIVPFCCIFASPAWLYLQAAAVLFFPGVISGTDVHEFSGNRWLMWSVYVPFFGLLAWNLVRKRNLFDNRAFRPPAGIAAIVPTLNEAENIGGCLDALGGQPEVTDIVVADGGSVDATRARARREGVSVIQAPRGRGLQVAAGVDAVDADVYLILHADCRLSAGAAARIINNLRSRPDMPGGGFGMRFEANRLKSRCIAGLNNFRAGTTGIFFGDQGQFFRREALAEMGGYPAIPLMEDVELSMRLKSAGPPLFLAQGIVASERRWLQPGFGAKVVLVVRLCLSYLFERRWRGRDLDANRYYGAYYRDGRRHVRNPPQG